MIPFSFWRKNYHNDAVSLFERMTALGETPSASTREAINTLITTSDHVYGNWSKYEFFYMTISEPGFINSSKLNWKGNAAYDLTELTVPVTGMTFTNANISASTYETFTATAGGFSAINTADWGIAYYNIGAYVAVGQKITVSFDLTVNSGAAPLVSMGGAGNNAGGGATAVRSSAGSNQVELIATAPFSTGVLYIHIYNNNGEASDYTVSNITITIHPYWSAAKGWKGDGRTTGCGLTTNFDPLVNKTVIDYNNVALGCMYDHPNQNAVLTSLMGTVGNSYRMEVFGRKSSTPYQRTNANNNVASSTGVVDGSNNYTGNYFMLDAVRPDASNHQQYQNGALTGTTARAAAALASNAITICRSSLTGAVGNPTYIAHAYCGSSTINFQAKNDYVRQYCTTMGVTL